MSMSTTPEEAALSGAAGSGADAAGDPEGPSGAVAEEHRQGRSRCAAEELVRRRSAVMRQVQKMFRRSRLDGDRPPQSRPGLGLPLIDSETIYALASAPSRAGVAVVRLSQARGAGGARAARAGARPAAGRAPGALCDPATGAPLDDGLALVFPGRRASPTRMWSSCTCTAARRCWSGCSQFAVGTGAARGGGEFTRRPANSKMDLTGPRARRPHRSRFGLATIAGAGADGRRLGAADRRLARRGCSMPSPGWKRPSTSPTRRTMPADVAGGAYGPGGDGGGGDGRAAGGRSSG